MESKGETPSGRVAGRASTTLVLAPVVSAGLLGLKVSPSPGRTAPALAADVGAVEVDLVTPVVETHLQVSTPASRPTAPC